MLRDLKPYKVHQKILPFGSEEYAINLQQVVNEQKNRLGTFFRDPERNAELIGRIRDLYLQHHIPIARNALLAHPKLREAGLKHGHLGKANLKSISALLGIPYDWVKVRKGAQNDLGQLVQRLFYLPFATLPTGSSKTRDLLEELVGAEILSVEHNRKYVRFDRKEDDSQLTLPFSSEEPKPQYARTPTRLRPDFVLHVMRDENSGHILGEAKNVAYFTPALLNRLNKYEDERIFSSPEVAGRMLFANADETTAQQIREALGEKLGCRWKLVTLEEYQPAFEAALSELNPADFSTKRHPLLTDVGHSGELASVRSKLMKLYHRAVHKPHSFLLENNSGITRTAYKYFEGITLKLEGREPRKARHFSPIERRRETILSRSDGSYGEVFFSGIDRLLRQIERTWSGEEYRRKQESVLQALPRYVVMDVEHTGPSSRGGIPSVIGFLDCSYNRGRLTAKIVQHSPKDEFEAQHVARKALLEIFRSHPTAPHVITYNGAADTRWLFDFVSSHEIRQRKFPRRENGVLYETDLFRKGHHFDYSLGILGGLAKYEENFIGSSLLQRLRKEDIGSRNCIQYYHRFVRTGNPVFLERIQHHNALDLVSTALMFAREILLTGSNTPDKGYLQGELRRLFRWSDEYHFRNDMLWTKLYGPQFGVYDFKRLIRKEMRPPLLHHYVAIPQAKSEEYWKRFSAEKLRLLDPELENGIMPPRFWRSSEYVQESMKRDYLLGASPIIYGHPFTRRSDDDTYKDLKKVEWHLEELERKRLEQVCEDFSF